MKINVAYHGQLRAAAGAANGVQQPQRGSAAGQSA
jgi:hypothetical protein